MFTGLVQDIGSILRFSPRGDGTVVHISTRLVDLELGESIAVDGACLSVTEILGSGFTAFASSETLEKTGLHRRPPGTSVNLERALSVGDPLGGHIVTGHVDTRVRLLEISRSTDAKRLLFAMPGEEDLSRQIASKGSIALGGVSLTVNHAGTSSFDVMVIPITLENTTLGALKPGDEINLETDVLAKYIARQLRRGDGGGGVDLDLLQRSGFIE